MSLRINNDWAIRSLWTMYFILLPSLCMCEGFKYWHGCPCSKRGFVCESVDGGVVHICIVFLVLVHWLNCFGILLIRHLVCAWYWHVHSCLFWKYKTLVTFLSSISPFDFYRDSQVWLVLLPLCVKDSTWNE